jgi:hypothetical protein
MEKLLAEFPAKGDDGKNYIICQFVDVITASSHDQDQEIQGRKWLQTKDGNPVNYIKKGTYQMFVGGTDVILRSDAPNAP